MLQNFTAFDNFALQEHGGVVCHVGKITSSQAISGISISGGTALLSGAIGVKDI